MNEADVIQEIKNLFDETSMRTVALRNSKNHTKYHARAKKVIYAAYRVCGYAEACRRANILRQSLCKEMIAQYCAQWYVARFYIHDKMS